MKPAAERRNKSTAPAASTGSPRAENECVYAKPAPIAAAGQCFAHGERDCRFCRAVNDLDEIYSLVWAATMDQAPSSSTAADSIVVRRVKKTLAAFQGREHALLRQLRGHFKSR